MFYVCHNKLVPFAKKHCMIMHYSFKCNWIVSKDLILLKRVSSIKIGMQCDIK